MRITGLIFVWVLTLCACVEQVPQNGPPARILAMGDSLMAWNGAGSGAISHAVEARLGQPVIDRSVVGAHMVYQLPISGALGLRIASQYVPGDWDWVILNGGGNDLWLGCGCGACAARMDRMVSTDGQSGAVTELVRKIRQGGARVIFVGYLRTPGQQSPIEGCGRLGDAYETRIARLAAQDRGVFFLSNANLVPNGDLSFHDVDRIHPSRKGSAAIGARVAALIKANGG